MEEAYNNGHNLLLQKWLVSLNIRNTVQCFIINLTSYAADKMMLSVIINWNIRVNAVDLRQYRPLPTESGLRNGVIVDFRCPDIVRVLKSNPDFFQPHQSYFLFSNHSFEQFLLPLQYQSGVRLDSDITIFAADGRIFDLYKIDNARHADAKIVLKDNGIWNGTSISADYNSNHYKISKRRDLMNVRLDAVIYVSGYNTYLAQGSVYKIPFFRWTPNYSSQDPYLGPNTYTLAWIQLTTLHSTTTTF